MPKKKSAKKTTRKKPDALFENRRLALIAAMKDQEVTSVELAKRLVPDQDLAKLKTMQGRISFLRRPSNPGKLQSEEAGRIAAALDVPLARLLAGELTDGETAAAGGSVPKAKGSKRDKTLLKDRTSLGGERRQLLKKTMGVMTAGELHQRLVAAGKKWNRSHVLSYVNGPVFPNKEFLTDVGSLLGVNSSVLIIRETPLENMGRHKTKVVASAASGSVPTAPASSAGGLVVQVTCTPLGIQVSESIIFDSQLKQFSGGPVKVRREGSQHFLEVSVPIPVENVSALLGLVLS